MTSKEPRLGQDYVLGVFLSPEGEPHAVRLTASPSRCTPKGESVDALYETVRSTGALKFLLVPVGELTPPVEALKKEIERQEAWQASFPICAVCGERRSKDLAEPCVACFTLGNV